MFLDKAVFSLLITLLSVDVVVTPLQADALKRCNVQKKCDDNYDYLQYTTRNKASKVNESMYIVLSTLYPNEDPRRFYSTSNISTLSKSPLFGFVLTREFDLLYSEELVRIAASLRQSHSDSGLLGIDVPCIYAGRSDCKDGDGKLIKRDFSYLQSQEALLALRYPKLHSIYEEVIALNKNQPHDQYEFSFELYDQNGTLLFNNSALVDIIRIQQPESYHLLPSKSKQLIDQTYIQYHNPVTVKKLNKWPVFSSLQMGTSAQHLSLKYERFYNDETVAFSSNNVLPWMGEVNVVPISDKWYAQVALNYSGESNKGIEVNQSIPFHIDESLFTVGQ